MKRTIALLLLVGCALAAVPADASTFRRAGLEELVVKHDQVVVGEVVDATSYWNAEGTMILTDVRIAPSETLKGTDEGGLVTVTQMGGTVGDTTVLIVGGAELAPGREYVLFIASEELPGVGRVPSVREHGQGAFEVVDGPAGPRAVSQAGGHPLTADASGAVEPPGGAEGMPLAELRQAVRDLADRARRGEVRR